MTVLLLHNRTALLLIRTLLPLNRTSLTPPRSPLIRHHGEGEYLKLAPTALDVIMIMHSALEMLKDVKVFPPLYLVVFR